MVAIGAHAALGAGKGHGRHAKALKGQGQKGNGLLFPSSHKGIHFPRGIGAPHLPGQGDEFRLR